MVDYLGLADLMLIAEAILGTPAEELARQCNLNMAESALAAPAACFGTYEHYETMAQKAAALNYKLSHNHPFIDGNKRIAYEALREFVARNGYEWTPPAGDDPDGDETVKMMWDVAAGQITQEELTRWVAERIGEPA
jgi:death on curing protein